MIFYLFEEQDGGCDYTIGCGFRLTTLKAKSMEDAEKEVVNEYHRILTDMDGDWEDQADRAKILGVFHEKELSIQGIINSWSSTNETKENRQEREEYERLKKKFGS